MIISILVNWQEREAVGKSAVDMAQQQCHDRSLGVTYVLQAGTRDRVTDCV
jgi:hypothetical protein